MDEERTQAPSSRIRALARERGLVASSAELTGALAFLAGIGLLKLLGGSAAGSLIDLTRVALSEARTSLTGGELISLVTAQMRAPLLALGAILAGIAGVAITAHQLQVRGLFTPERLVPDFSRLGPKPFGSSLAKGVWDFARGLALVLASLALVRSACLSLLVRAPASVPLDLSIETSAVLGPLFALGLLMLAFGALDFALEIRRVETKLLQTPEEARQDLRAVDGDPLVRARRRRLANQWRIDAGHLFGASLAILGARDLCVILRGEVQPGRLRVAFAADGREGAGLRQTVTRRGVPTREEPALARKLARRAIPGAVLPPSLVEDVRKLLS